MTVKRIFLNMGMALTVIALILYGIQQYYNSFLEIADGTVLSKYNDLDGFYNIKFYSDKSHYGVKYLPEMNIKIGDNISVFYDRRSPEDIADKLNLWAFIVMLGLPGLMMIIFCCTAFKGYKADFIDKMSKQAKFTVLSIFAALISEIILCMYCFNEDSLENAVLLVIGAPAIIILTITANITAYDTYKYRKNSDTK